MFDRVFANKLPITVHGFSNVSGFSGIHKSSILFHDEHLDDESDSGFRCRHSFFITIHAFLIVLYIFLAAIRVTEAATDDPQLDASQVI